MRTSDFDYALPEELIAQHPLPERDASRLMVLPRAGTAPPAHHRFTDLPRLLPSGTLLVLNDTRVIPARLHGHKPTGGRVELLLLEPDAAGPDRWRCLYSAAKPLRVGTRIVLDRDPAATAEVRERHDEGRVTCAFEVAGGLAASLARLGEVPLPPYVRRPDGEAPADRSRYQTIFARADGAVAAPTAGLHFTSRLLAALEDAGVETRWVTLHVGPGTFVPVKASDPAQHRMHSEPYVVGAATATSVNAAHAAGRPVVAVGTTVVRTLESATDAGGAVRPGPGRAELFITPGYRFRAVDGLLTNFHLPRSTLLMLVAALCGRERLLDAYRAAMAERYRFYSYGDAMLVLP
ncbi:MAG: tRNA preQ1(34) S-adenosylmethionine ribosyltransferase-isomerase QueA [Deltaproteobacteria bacterium]|nr:tRNA preQ1(34) S-adenosylmethionine ribosyltransferase-isomerase QueA [Deltaproteobacteria bacterium]